MLQTASSTSGSDQFQDLITQVDAALSRIDNGTFGICETCHESIEADRLLADPLVRVCLDHLSRAELRAHEDDLELATRIQSKLLPARDLRFDGWETHYRYAAAGPVGGDYCEIIPLDDGSFFFAVGDVAGKGVAASLLMTHLSAILRSLISLRLPMTEVMTRANHLFCEATLASHYATLLFGRVTPGETIEISNAGHPPPFAVRCGGVQRLDIGGLPLGLFCTGEYAVHRLELAPGESLVLYSDGVTEAQSPAGDQFGEDQLIASLNRATALDAKALIGAVLADLVNFKHGAPATDDVTLLAIRRRP